MRAVIGRTIWPVMFLGFLMVIAAVTAVSANYSPAQLCEDQSRTLGGVSNGVVSCIADNDNMVLNIEVDENGMPISFYWTEREDASTGGDGGDDGSGGGQSGDGSGSSQRSASVVCEEQYRVTYKENGDAVNEKPTLVGVSNGVVSCQYEDGSVLNIEVDENWMPISFYWSEQGDSSTDGASGSQSNGGSNGGSESNEANGGGSESNGGASQSTGGGSGSESSGGNGSGGSQSNGANGSQSNDGSLPALCQDQYRTTTDGSGNQVVEYPSSGETGDGVVLCYWSNGMVLTLEVDENGMPISSYWSQQ